METWRVCGPQWSQIRIPLMWNRMQMQDPDPHRKEKMDPDPDPHKSEKLDPEKIRELICICSVNM